MSFQAVDLTDEEEGDKGHNQKIEDGIDEEAIIQGRCSGGFGLGDCFVMPIGQIEEEVIEIQASQQKSDGGHEDVVDEGRDDFAEGSADDHTDGEVHDTAFERELLKFFEHDSPFLF